MTDTAPATAPPGAFTHRQILTIMSGLLLGMFLAALDQTIVSAAMRTIADDLHNLEGQAWATTAYLVTSTIVTPLYGKLSDIYGRKPFFTAAISIFIVGSMLCTLAQSMPQLAVYRAVQGLGAGGLFSLALAIIGDIVPPRERARYQGYFLAVFGTSSVLGPVAGGFLAGQDSILGVAGWRWVFLINVPIGIIALIVVTRTLQLRHVRLDHRIDYLGAAALIVGVVPLLVLAEQGRTWGWLSTGSLLCGALGVAGLIAFVLIERRMGDEAILPLRLFSDRTIAVGSISGVLLGMGMFGGLASIPLYLQIVKGESATTAGLLMLPMTLGMMSGSILTGQRISRTGTYRHWPMIGTALISIALFVLHFTHFDTSLWQTLSVLLFFGFGLGLCMQTLTLAVQNAVPPRDIGVATSSTTFMRQMGGTLGTAVFLSVLFSAAPTRIADAMKTYGPGNPDFAAALKAPTGDAGANAQFISSLTGGSSAGLNPLADSSFLQLIDPRLAKPFLVGFSSAIDQVFLLGAVVMAVAFVITTRLPAVTLRATSAYQERQEGANLEAGQAAAAPVPASAPAPASALAAGQGEGIASAPTDVPQPAVASGAITANGVTWDPAAPASDKPTGRHRKQR